MRARVSRHLDLLLRAEQPRPQAELLTKLAEGGLREPREKTPPELPDEFSWRDYAIFLLHIAAEIEHALMVQYLYAAYSLGGPKAHAAEASKWQRVILGIAKEEMGHFLTVQNVLRLIGGALNLDREDYPWDTPFYPFQFRLEPLTRPVLAKYIVAESPERWPTDIRESEKEDIMELASGSAQEAINRVGALYDAVIDILKRPDAISDQVFRSETVPFQASWDEWGRGYRAGQRGSSPVGVGGTPDLIVQRVASRSDAVAALQAIAHQGEAPEADGSISGLSHFRRFLAMFRAFPEWSPARPVAINPKTPGPSAGADDAVIEHREAVLWAKLFNTRYRMLLSYLGHVFELSAEPGPTGVPGARGMVVNRIFAEMYNMRSIAEILVELPASDGLEERAAPPFQMPYSLALPTAEIDFWRLHADLIAGAAKLLEKLRGTAGGTRLDYAVALTAADRRSRNGIEQLLGSFGIRSQPTRMVGSSR